MIPEFRSELGAAINQLNAALVGLNQRGYLATPWLGDEISAEVSLHYTSRAMDGLNSSYQSLIAYRDELTRAHDTLQQMEDDYRRGEGDRATRLGRMA
jgi:hypothetical protein